MTRQEFWFSSPRQLQALANQHGVANGVLETKEQAIQREMANVKAFMEM